MTLILPPHIQAQRRPYAAAPTADLLTELQHRGELQEMTVQGAMPPPADIAEQKLTEAQIQVLRQQGFAAAFQQIGPALGASDLPFTGTGMLPPDNREMLVIKVLVVRHPLRPKPPATMPIETSPEPA